MVLVHTQSLGYQQHSFRLLLLYVHNWYLSFVAYIHETYLTYVHDLPLVPLVPLVYLLGTLLAVSESVHLCSLLLVN